MGYNKVVYNGTTLIDLTRSRITPDQLLTGVTAHDRKGNVITGTFLEGYPDLYIHKEPLYDSDYRDIWDSDMDDVIAGMAYRKL